MIKAVIFDFDGTLCDTRRAISAVLVETFRTLGKRPPAGAAIDATLARGITLEETLAELEPWLADRPDDCQTWVKLYREIYNAGLGVRSAVAFPGAAEALAALSELGVPAVIASNKGERAVEGTLRHLGLDHHVHLVVAASGAMATKPDPASFTSRIAPSLPELEPASYLVIGDTATDIRYARAIGAQAAWVAHGYGGPECRELGPDYVVEHLGELAALVRRAGERVLSVECGPRVHVLDAIGRSGPPSQVATYTRAFCQPGLSRGRAQDLVARMTGHLLEALRPALAEVDVIVPVARAGMAMWPVASKIYGAPASCFAIARKDKEARTVEVAISSGLCGDECSALLLDTVSATGDTVVAVAGALRERAPACRIVAAICYAAPPAIAAIAGSGLVDHLIVGTRATGVDAGWLVPRTQGDVGDKLFGSGAAGAP